jgi:hypothetical protein
VHEFEYALRTNTTLTVCNVHGCQQHSDSKTGKAFLLLYQYSKINSLCIMPGEKREMKERARDSVSELAVVEMMQPTKVLGHPTFPSARLLAKASWSRTSSADTARSLSSGGSTKKVGSGEGGGGGGAVAGDGGGDVPDAVDGAMDSAPPSAAMLAEAAAASARASTMYAAEHRRGSIETLALSRVARQHATSPLSLQTDADPEAVTEPLSRGTVSTRPAPLPLSLPVHLQDDNNDDADDEEEEAFPNSPVILSDQDLQTEQAIREIALGEFKQFRRSSKLSSDLETMQAGFSVMGKRRRSSVEPSVASLPELHVVHEPRVGGAQVEVKDPLLENSRTATSNEPRSTLLIQVGNEPMPAASMPRSSLFQDAAEDLGLIPKQAEADTGEDAGLISFFPEAVVDDEDEGGAAVKAESTFFATATTEQELPPVAGEGGSEGVEAEGAVAVDGTAPELSLRDDADADVEAGENVGGPVVGSASIVA